MTPRRVILTLEVKTDAPLVVLRRAANVDLTVFDGREWTAVGVLQAQANVVKGGDDE